MIATIDKSEFPKHITPKIGLHLEIKHPEGGIMNLTIVDMNEDTITMDGNHPLAGKILTFDVELVGINSCNGCPTIAGVETILPKIESLIFYGATHIHLSYCMLVLCPFVKKYMKVINDKFTKIELITGTHKASQTNKKFKEEMQVFLNNRHKIIIP